MGAYLVRRLIRTVLVVLFVTVVVSLILRLSGDPITVLVGTTATPETIAEIRHRMGLDQPIWVQVARFLLGMLKGDFGTSLVYGTPALSLVAGRFLNTVQLSIVAMVLAVLLSVPLGILSALKQGTAIDTTVLGICILGQSMPGFWLGVMLILIMAVQLHLLPTSGKESARSIILPAFTLAVFFLARFTLLLRSSMVEVLAEDYVRTARAKGLHERVIIYVHVLRNAIIPLVTMIGISMGMLLGGAVITESVFAWPGIGYLALQAVYSRDYAVVQTSVFVIAFCIAISNLAVDLLYPVLDPRITVKQ